MKPKYQVSCVVFFWFLVLISYKQGLWMPGLQAGHKTPLLLPPQKKKTKHHCPIAVIIIMITANICEMLQWVLFALV